MLLCLYLYIYRFIIIVATVVVLPDRLYKEHLMSINILEYTYL
jgi:hypothetical protein